MCKKSTPVATPAMVSGLQSALNTLGVLISAEAATTVLEKTFAADKACPNAAHMAEHACANRHQCWEPCGELGHSAEHACVSKTKHLQVRAALGLPSN